MEKMKKCKACGAGVAKNAKICPQCGAKLKRPILGTILVIFGVLLIVGAVGSGMSNDEPHKAGENTPPRQEETQGPTTFGIGEKVELNGVVVTLDGIKESEGSQFNKPSEGNVFLLCEFTIENNSEKDLSISSLMCFAAYVDDFSTNMSLTAMIEKDKEQLDGTIAAGKKMNGQIGYEVPADWNTFEIRFIPDFWSGSDIIFVHSK